ncbi:MAG: hypothetical protein IKE18_08380 [Oscillospiraceae bacterium]|nr:hypothetical protein [Oscillospiraceae bacterium]
MKKLFTLVRQGNLEELKRILSAKPELLGCVAGPQPKKDHGQSLLQVALKTGHLDIADYLIDAGIDVDFMEEEDDDPGLRAPVLFDAITAAIDTLCINQFASREEVQKRFEMSDRALGILEKIIAGGADVNKRASNGLSALNWGLHHTEQIMKNAGIYPFSQEKVREQFMSVLDLLIRGGADIETWRKEGSYPEPCPGSSVQVLYFDSEDPGFGINYSSIREMRDLLQTYFSRRRNMME